MIDRIAHIDKSIEKWYFPAAIKQIKEIISVSEITLEAKNELNQKLLACLDSRDFETHKKIKEIEKILEDKLLFAKLDNIHKSKLYESIWDSYFDLGNFLNAIEFYQLRFSLWNTNTLKTIVYISIFFYFQANKTDIVIQDSLSHIFEELDRNINLLGCVPNIKNDLILFFYWPNDVPINYAQWPLFERLYFLEMIEENSRQNINETLSSYLTKEEQVKVLSTVRNELIEFYNALINDFPENGSLLVAKTNMIKRFAWNYTDYSEFWNYIKEFITALFQINDVLLRNRDYEKSLYLLKFVTDYWYKNTDLIDKSLITFYLNKTLNEPIDFPDFYHAGISNILWNISWSFVNPWDILSLADLYIKEKDYYRAFWNIKSAIDVWLDWSEQLRKLLLDILMNKEFEKPLESELRFWKVQWTKILEVKKLRLDPEIEISFLLEKLERWQALTQGDYESIEELCVLQ